MASMIKIFDEKTISPYFERLDKVKVAKIMDFTKNYPVEVSKGEMAPTLAVRKILSF